MKEDGGTYSKTGERRHAEIDILWKAKNSIMGISSGYTAYQSHTESFEERVTTIKNFSDAAWL